MEIAVQFTPLERQADSIGGYADALQCYAADIRRVRSNLNAAIKTKSNISAALNSAVNSLEARAQAMFRMERGLQELIPVYRVCETSLAGKKLTQNSGSSNADTAPEWDTWFNNIIKLFQSIVITKPSALPIICSLISPFASPEIIGSGAFVNLSSIPTSNDTGWFGYKLNEEHPGITAWIGKASAEVQNESAYAGVNGYIGKVETEGKATAGFMQTTTKHEYKNGEWSEKEMLAFLAAEASAEVSAAVLAGDAKAGVGDDMLGAEVAAEGAVGSAKANAKGKFSVGEEGVNAYVGGEAMVSAAEGKASGTINILGIEITGKVSGYAGALGVTGKVGIEDNKFVMDAGAAALFGFSAGVEIGFNDEGWTNFVDFITFWD